MNRRKSTLYRAKNVKRALGGFTIIEIIACLATLAVIMGTMIPLGIQITLKRHEQQTLDELAKLKVAVLGDPQVVADGVRLSFGYVGDMGNLPASLEDLYKKGSQPAFSFDATKKMGAGWHGPYIGPQIAGHLETLQADAFGNNYDYTTTPFTDSTVGITVDGRIRSGGGDGTSGTSDDLSVELFSSEINSKIVGSIEDSSGDRLSGATVTVNYPSNGILTTSSALTNSNGFFTMDDIPYGIRSMSIVSGMLSGTVAVTIQSPVTEVGEITLR